MKFSRTIPFKSVIMQPILPHFNPTFSCCLKPSFHFREKPLKDFEFNIKRRIGAIAAMGLVLMAKEATFIEVANGFEFQLVAPDQSIEEAEGGITGHAQALLEVKDLIESESWREVQIALRKSSSFLKQDIYTIIQGKPGSERPQLRKLYSDLFNNVTKLDYAVRDKDASHIRQFYEKIVVTLNQILSRL